MGIDEARENRRAIEVDEFRSRTRRGFDLVEVAYRRDPTIANRDCSRDRVCLIAGHHAPTMQDDRLHPVIISTMPRVSGGIAAQTPPGAASRLAVAEPAAAACPINAAPSFLPCRTTLGTQAAPAALWPAAAVARWPRTRAKYPA